MARLAHRRIPNDGQITALVAHLFSGPHCGHALQGEHPPSSSVANGAEASPEAFDSRLPPRDVASEDGMFCPHIPKLDSSAPCFIQSRTLVQHANGFTSRLAMKSRCPISTLAVGIASSHSSYAASLGSGRPHCSREASASWRTAARPTRGRETDCVAGLVGLELANVGLKIAI